VPGTKHDDGKPMLDLLDPGVLIDVAQVFTFGAQKYAPHNWRDGIYTSRLYASLMRHLLAFWSGEENDPESGLPHLAHAGCCLMMLAATVRDLPEWDNRYRKPEEIIVGEP